mgnify:CR=1 FL=1
MIIDCAECKMHHTEACEDCVVTALMGPGGILELAEDERRAIDAMSHLGLVSPIRLQPRSATGG